MEFSPEFIRFWQEYPRKVGKLAAWNSFQKHELGGIIDEVLRTVEKYKKTEQWQTPKLVPHPATWINQGRWMDEIEDSEWENF